MDKPLKEPPTYAVASVDHALQMAAVLQLEARSPSRRPRRGLVSRARPRTGCSGG